MVIPNECNETRRAEETETGSGGETETETKSQVEEKKKKKKKKKKDWEWEPKRHGHSLKAKPRKKSQKEELRGGSLMSVGRIGGSMIETCVEPGWRVNDILLAAGVLRRVQPAPEYSDEAEMRRVFGLVYDVLRCKSNNNAKSSTLLQLRATFSFFLLLSSRFSFTFRVSHPDKKIFVRALEDTGFWQRNAAIKDQEKIVWLLLYDMQGRKFATEIANLEERERIFEVSLLLHFPVSLSIVISV